jgi:predicted amidohydrolase YtcJ
LGLTVVTQPNFVYERGSQYLSEVDADDRPFMYRLKSLSDREIPVAAGTDAPFGRPDPWAAMRAAMDRVTANGTRLGEQEAIGPHAALLLFSGTPLRPGSGFRAIRPGADADFCLLGCSLRDALRTMDRSLVRATIIRGSVVFEA